MSKVDKKLDQMQSQFKAFHDLQSEFKILHDYVMSNKQQQNVVPTEVQSVSPPAASALHPKASDDAQGNSQSVGAHPDVRVQQPPSHSRFHSAPQQKRRGCFICQDTGHFPLNNGNNPSFRFGTAPNHVVRSSGQAEQNGTPPPHMYMSRGAGTKIKDEYVYIDIGIDGKTHLALLDTGCQLSLTPPSLVGSRPCLLYTSDAADE